MDDYGLDWNAIAKYIGPDPLLTPSQGDEARIRLKEAFADGRMVAGTLCAGYQDSKRIGCAIGQAENVLAISLQTIRLTVAINNFTCLGLPMPDEFIGDNGIPTNYGGKNRGKPLTTIDPLLRLIDLFVEGGR